MKVRTSVFLVVGLMLLAACSQPATSDNGGFGSPANNQQHVGASHPPEASAPAAPQGSAAAAPIQPVIATSELVVGPNRMAIGILQNNVPIEDAAQTKVKVRYYKVEGTQGTLVGEEDLQYYGENLGPRGTFIGYPNFDTAGNWGMDVIVQRPGQNAVTLRSAIEVKERANAPKIGDAAPSVTTPTASEVSDLKTISSDTEPDPRLYQMSVDQAVTSGKPSLIMFATPGYCETAVCFPGVDVMKRLKDKYGDQINTVHVEIYKLPYTGETVPAFGQWNLQSEPWLFLVDENGKIAGRFEGGITYQEMEPEVAKLVQ